MGIELGKTFGGVKGKAGALAIVTALAASADAVEASTVTLNTSGVIDTVSGTTSDVAVNDNWALSLVFGLEATQATDTSISTNFGTFTPSGVVSADLTIGGSVYNILGSGLELNTVDFPVVDSIGVNVTPSGGPSGANLISFGAAYGPLTFVGDDLKTIISEIEGASLDDQNSSFFMGFGGGFANGSVDQHSMTVTNNVAAVPLPESGFLLAGAAIGLAGLRRRRKGGAVEAQPIEQAPAPAPI